MRDDGGMPDLRPDMTIGERLKVARRFAGLNQEQLAERAGINVDTIRKLEQSARQSARISTINALAHAVNVETITLLQGIVHEAERGAPALLALRSALIPVDDFVPAADEEDEDSPPDLDTLRRSVQDAWGDYHTGDFAALGDLVPGLWPAGSARTSSPGPEWRTWPCMDSTAPESRPTVPRTPC